MNDAVLVGIHKALSDQATALNDLVRAVEGLTQVVADGLNPEPPEGKVFSPNPDDGSGGTIKIEDWE